MKFFNKYFIVLIVVLISLGTILPLFHAGFFPFHDNTQVVRVYEMTKSLSYGIFPVRWVSDLGYGYGYPIFNFYAPFPYYIGSLFVLLGDVLIATKIMFALGIIASGVTMYFFSRRFFGNSGGIASAVVYAYFPYHAVNIYVRGAVDEFFAYAFLPVVFLGLYRLIILEKSQKTISKNILTILLIGLGIFLVAVSHNLSLYMLLLLLVPFIAISLFTVKTKRFFIAFLVISVLLGILFSSFYILPAFLEMKYTNVFSQIGGGANYSDHFVCLNQYWNSTWGFGGSVAGCNDGLSFKLGKTNIFLLVTTLAAFLYLLKKKKFRDQEKTVLTSFVMFVISVFLTLQISQFIWSSIPYMKFIQYPWRFINFAGLFLAFLVGFLPFAAKEIFKEKAGFGVLIFIILITIFSNYKLFYPQEYNSYPSSFYTQDNYMKYTVSKISDEYMPSGFGTPKEIAGIPTNSAVLLKTTGSLEVKNKRPNYLNTAYDISNDGVIHLNLAYFPSWRAYLNTQEVPIVPTYRGMNVSIPQGKGVLELKFEQTPIEVFGNTLSLIAFLAVFIGIILNIPLIKHRIRLK